MKVTSLETLLESPVDLSDLMEAVDFSDEEILDAAKGQCNFFLQAARLYVQKTRKRVAREAKLKEIISRRSLLVRSSITEGGERATEGLVSAKLDRIPAVQKAKRRLEDAKLHEEYAKLLLEAFRMRRDVIKVVANLIGAEVFIARENSGHDALTKAKQRLKHRYKEDLD